MAMSTETAALLRIIKRDAEAIAQGRITGGSAVVVAGRIKDVAGDLVKSAERDQEAAG